MRTLLRVRLFFGFFDRQTGQRQPTIGMPWLVPEPKTTISAWKFRVSRSCNAVITNTLCFVVWLDAEKVFKTRTEKQERKNRYFRNNRSEDGL